MSIAWAPEYRRAGEPGDEADKAGQDRVLLAHSGARLIIGHNVSLCLLPVAVSVLGQHW